MKLSARLVAIARLIPKGKIVADIGTDHGILPVYLVSQGISPTAIASDLNKGPLEAAKKTVTEAGLSHKIKLRLGFGLETVEFAEADVAVIAGMGGGTISKIIEASGDQCPVKELVMQPMGDSGQLREWLVRNGWKIIDEDIIEEGGRYYEIIYSVKGREQVLDQSILTIGPRLFEKKHPLLEKLIKREIEGNTNIIASLEQGLGEEIDFKRNGLIERNRHLERIIDDCKVSDNN